MSLVNETFSSETETRPRRLAFRPRRDRDPPKFSETETRPRRLKKGSRDRLETETSRPRLHPCRTLHIVVVIVFVISISVLSRQHRIARTVHLTQHIVLAVIRAIISVVSTKKCV